MSTLLTVGAHPDDTSIFWGGTVAKHVAEGWTVVAVTVDEGRGSPHSYEMSADELVTTRAAELAWESRRLGVRLEHFGLSGVKTPAARAVCRERLQALIAELRPERMIIHHLEDAHGTHVACGKLALAAIVAARAADPTLPWPEVWQADGWEPVHYPDVRVDVTRYMNLKMAAIAMHGSQIFDTPYLMGAWGICLYRAGFASSHEVTDPSCLFAEAFRRIAPDDVAAVAAANDPEA
ncbi:MAG: PIG-L family deacetylase [Fimbriimonadaceae bacterium]|nr:PIG-L family deacetylase [Fimbriimonadaceae bacterium]